MKFVCYSSWEQLPASAEALFARGEKQSIFLSRAWFENLAVYVLDRNESLLLASVVDGDQVLAILPLVKSVGDSCYSLKHRYTPFYSLLLVDEAPSSTLDCLVEGLSQMPVVSLLLEPVADNDSQLNRLQHSLESAGFNCERSFRLYNWVYRVQGGSFQEYMAARPARLRNTIARKQRKLEREQGYEIRLFRGADVPPAMVDYYAVYDASWKANEQYTQLVDDMVSAFSSSGWTRLAVLYINDRPIAAQLWFVLHGKANIFRLSYDQAWKSYSPGSILTSYLMEYVIDVDRVEEIDFLTGNDPYKQDWMSERRERYALSCVNRTPSSSGYRRFFSVLKRLMKR